MTTAAPASPATRRRTPGWVPILAGIAAFVVVLVGFGLGAADWTARNAEMNRLVTAIETSEAAMGDVQDQVELALAGIDTESGTLTDEQRAEVSARLQAVAEEGAQGIAAAETGVRNVRVLPWHRDIARARDAYLEHNRAWQDYLRAAAVDPSEMFADQPAVNETFLAVEPLLTQAVPDPALFDLDARVRLIFEEGQADGGEETQLAALAA